jgi:hypothetical protein
METHAAEDPLVNLMADDCGFSPSFSSSAYGATRSNSVTDASSIVEWFIAGVILTNAHLTSIQISAKMIACL